MPREQAGHVPPGRPVVGLGDDGTRAGGEEARREIVDALLGLVERRLGLARFGVPEA